MHCVTSLNTLRAKPWGISMEAQAWAKTRHEIAKMNSLERSDRMAFPRP